MARSNSRDVGSLDDFLCFVVHSAALMFGRVYRPVLDRLGLTYSQFLVIMCLWQRDDQPVGSIGETLFLESNTLTPLIKRLEAAGFVSRKRDRSDERVVRVSLTPAGRKLATEAAELPEQVLKAAGMSSVQLEESRASLRILRDKLGAAQHGGS